MAARLLCFVWKNMRTESAVPKPSQSPSVTAPPKWEPRKTYIHCHLFAANCPLKKDLFCTVSRKTVRLGGAFLLARPTGFFGSHRHACLRSALRNSPVRQSPAAKNAALQRFPHAKAWSRLQILSNKNMPRKKHPQGVLFSWRARQDLNLWPTGS